MKEFWKKTLVIFASALVGFCNGFFGGGGGMLLVPMLEKILKTPVKKSHATAIAIILPISIAGAITYIASGFFSPLSVFSTSAGCVGGGIVGALLLKKLPTSVIAIAFSLLMIAVAIKLIFFGG